MPACLLDVRDSSKNDERPGLIHLEDLTVTFHILCISMAVGPQENSVKFTVMFGVTG